ncbi:hypothetical protein EGT07_23790 [Herbaspirillum sp. HC18]|nr:hypothetical protein EGT07_23790 [Herbaspirillum sp. HC18]
MNRADRRRFEKEFAKLLKTASDNCSICDKPFEHNSKTFGGLAANKTVLAGECCVQKLDAVMTEGVYVTKYLDIPALAKQGDKKNGASAKDVTSAVAAFQSHITKLDTLADGVRKRAGLQSQPQYVSLADTPWKSDDAAWFKRHPDRSHRLRPIFEGEAATLPAAMTTMTLPGKHRWEILVRQVEIGKRARLAFCRNTEVVIPDAEEIIHAIFDVVSQPGKQGVISIEEIAALAGKYGAAQPGKPN